MSNFLLIALVTAYFTINTQSRSCLSFTQSPPPHTHTPHSWLHFLLAAITGYICVWGGMTECMSPTYTHARVTSQRKCGKEHDPLQPQACIWTDLRLYNTTQSNTHTSKQHREHRNAVLTIKFTVRGMWPLRPRFVTFEEFDQGRSLMFC